MTELVVDAVWKTLGQQPVLKGAGFSAERGTITALLGASGSGKSTLLRCIAGLEQPESGRISIGGRLVFDRENGLSLPPEQRQAGLVFQSYALWPHRSVEENVAYGLRLRGISTSERRRRVEEILTQMDLAHLAQRYPAELSGGQQQRVAICRALIYKPNILLLDEPLSNLDQKLRDESRYWIRKLILELQMCAILVTHDQNEALAVADNIMLLQRGEIVERGAPQALYSNPRTFYAASFIGTNNLVEGRLARGADGADLIVGDGWALQGVLQGESKRPSDSPARAVIRSEQVRIVETCTDDSIGMELVDSSFLGDRWEYRLAKAGLQLKAYGEKELPRGNAMVTMPRDKVWIFA